ncbi:MAG TPA: pantoate--beta-alanine ligase, partial [Flavitalea sp.]|nr:pantoate--beta-alanine ligase [Flavitalea sp.]
GVCQVMNRLLLAVQPDHLFMGQKDYQQCMVVKELCRQEHLRLEFHAIATVREEDGLALSSRNRRLSPDERKAAPAIFQCMAMIKEGLRPGETEPLRMKAEQFLKEAGFRVDYVCIAAADSLEPVSTWNGQQPVVVLIAAFVGEVRLIDNLLLSS